MNKWELIKCKSFCTTKETNEQHEKTILSMGEDICKWSYGLQLISKVYKQLNMKKKKKLIF